MLSRVNFIFLDLMKSIKSRTKKLVGLALKGIIFLNFIYFWCCLWHSLDDYVGTYYAKGFMRMAEEQS